MCGLSNIMTTFCVGWMLLNLLEIALDALTCFIHGGLVVIVIHSQLVMEWKKKKEMVIWKCTH